MRISARVTGVQQVLRIRKSERKKHAMDMVEGLVLKAGVVLRKAQHYVPKETHALEQSGHIEQEGKGFAARVKIVFGGPGAPYALYVHENLAARHEPPTCAKFLERAERETRGPRANIMKGREEAHEQQFTKEGVIVS